MNRQNETRLTPKVAKFGCRWLIGYLSLLNSDCLTGGRGNVLLNGEQSDHSTLFVPSLFTFVVPQPTQLGPSSPLSTVRPTSPHQRPCRSRSITSAATESKPRFQPTSGKYF